MTAREAGEEKTRPGVTAEETKIAMSEDPMPLAGEGVQGTMRATRRIHVRIGEESWRGHVGQWELLHGPRKPISVGTRRHLMRC